MFHLKTLAVLYFFGKLCKVNAQDDLQSTCPHFYLYEGICNEPDRMYGIIVILADTDLNGIKLRLVFDRPSIKLANWVGEVSTSNNNNEYFIKNDLFRLKANTPKIVRFYVQYHLNQPMPKLILYELNGRIVCSERRLNEKPQYTIHSQENNIYRNVSGSTGNRFAQNDGKLEENIRKPIGPHRNPASPSRTDDAFLFPDEIYRDKTHHLHVSVDNDDLDSYCGTVITQPLPLVNYYNGPIITYEGQFPWYAAVYHVKGMGLAYICGGSLISKYHVVTAAHCVCFKKSGKPLDPQNLAVYLGKHYLKLFSSYGVQNRFISEVIPHPQFDHQTYDGDIAVLKFTKPIDITEFVRPICLWQDSPDLNSIFNKHGNVIGWGFDKAGRVLEELVATKLFVVAHEKCIPSSFPDYYSRFRPVNTYCAGYANGTTVCNGDSGTGMVYPITQTSRWQLRGIVSVSAILQNVNLKCNATGYTVFTDVAKYLDWVKESVKLSE